MLPTLFELYGYKIFFWSNENNEPVHVHVAKCKPSADATRFKSGRTVGVTRNVLVKLSL